MNIKQFVKVFLLGILLLTHSKVVLSQGNLSELPDWFYKTSNYNSKNIAIGISDIQLDTTVAFNQAKLKALLNYSLLNNSNLSSLTTSNVGNQQSNSNNITTYEYVINSTIIKGELPLPTNIKVIDSAYTKNKEAIILIEIPERTDSTYEFVIKRRAGFQKENVGDPFFADELDIEIFSKTSTIYRKSFYKKGNSIKLDIGQELFVNELFYIPESVRIYQYLNKGEHSPQSLPASLNSGLFAAYIFNLIDQICIYNSFKTDFHHKLSSSDIGKLETDIKNESLQQYVYSLKNVQSRIINTKLVNINTKNNQLYTDFKQKNTKYEFEQQTYTFNRADKKEQKKLLEENWKYLGKHDVVNAWFGAKNGILGQSENILIGGADLVTNNLNSGFLAAINLAKLELSSQLSSKINALTNTEVTNEGSTYVQSAKLLNLTKTDEIKPFYLFYKEINPITFQVKAILFYQFKE